MQQGSGAGRPHLVEEGLEEANHVAMPHGGEEAGIAGP